MIHSQWYSQMFRESKRERESFDEEYFLIIQLFSKILKGSAELDRGRCQESWAEK